MSLEWLSVTIVMISDYILSSSGFETVTAYRRWPKDAQISSVACCGHRYERCFCVSANLTDLDIDAKKSKRLAPEKVNSITSRDVVLLK